MDNAAERAIYEDNSPDKHYCAIHGEPFTMSEDGGCPSCMEEWSPIEPDDEGDVEDGKEDAG